ncbi:MAG: histidinol-phosphatase [Sphingomonas sp.]|nr:histidinol-phosphatase [Sphingomonas sp.]
MSRDFFDRLGDAARIAIELCETDSVDNKDENGLFDPVTEADRAAERAMRALIEKNHPEDGIWGEEYGWTRAGAARHWSLDPIDGTRAFICGLPSWAVLAGLIEDGEHVGGMIDLPDLDERLIGFDGETTLNGAIVETSGCCVLGEARISTTDPHLFEGAQFDAFSRLRAQVPLVRYGLDAMAFARVATGDIDLATDVGLKPHDYDALVACVRFAGGHIGNWTGGDDLSGGDVIAAASEALYRQAVGALKG